MKRKCLAVGIIILFVGTSVIPITAKDIGKSSLLTYGGKWLYVGGSGPGNYSVIQDAVDNASDGDTVFVYKGIYSDYFPDNFACVNIVKKISLIGEDKYNTIIDGSNSKYDAICIGSDFVNISGFTIQKAAWSGIHIEYHPAGLDVVHNVTVHDTIIQGNEEYGIAIYTAINSSFYNNIIRNNYYVGIWITGNGCIIRNSTISYNQIGIEVISVSGKNIIEYNNIRNNKRGVYISFPSAIFQHNNFIKNLIPAAGGRAYMLRAVIENPSLLFPREQLFDNNYWDHWKSSLPKPIVRLILLQVMILDLAILPIGWFPTFQFDWHPAKKPFDIPGIS